DAALAGGSKRPGALVKPPRAVRRARAKTTDHIAEISKFLRYHIIDSTMRAGSGHPSSSLSPVELMATLYFGGHLRYDVNDPKNPNNDVVIYSKGHAAPLLYALHAAAGTIDVEELQTLRRPGSRLGGHPSVEFPHNKVATGSLGMGLSVGLGVAYNAKYFDHVSHKTYVLVGDGELAEGSNWEAMQLAAHYKLNNLIGILDVNRLGQRGETMLQHDLGAYVKRIRAFGWDTIVIDGHDPAAVDAAYKKARRSKTRPTMIVAKTIKGKGLPASEDRPEWQAVIPTQEQADEAFAGLGAVDQDVRGRIRKPTPMTPRPLPAPARQMRIPRYKGMVSPRMAAGRAATRLVQRFPGMVVLDAETGKSTGSKGFERVFPGRFFESFIAEQAEAGAAWGFSAQGKTPVVFIYAAFLHRMGDWIRMWQWNKTNIKIVGTHAGVSTGPDGPSHHALDDLALMRSLDRTVVLYPSDAVSTERVVELGLASEGNSYVRATREDLPVLYDAKEKFRIGGSKTLRRSKQDVVTVVGAGVTVHEALAAHAELAARGVRVRVIDLYSVKPVDRAALRRAARETRAILTVEDHHAQGGIADAVREALADSGIGTPVHSLAVTRKPTSGTPAELREYVGIDRASIVKKVERILK
ncbi:MAG TPA: transketolase, partial [Kofleriaceae bacterium]|nr:transketolase [Kofleriaceae bacterium]